MNNNSSTENFSTTVDKGTSVDLVNKTTKGTTYDDLQQFNQRADFYNASETVKLNPERKLVKDENTGEYLPLHEQPKEAREGFEEHAKQVDYNENLQKSIVSEAMATIGTAGTALLGGMLLNKFAGNPVGRLWKKSSEHINKMRGKNGDLSSFDKSVPNQASDISNYTNNNQSDNGKNNSTQGTPPNNFSNSTTDLHNNSTIS